MSDRIDSVDELRKAQAAAQNQGMSITNYEEWENILENLDQLGIQSTGSYSGDVKLFSQVMEDIMVAAEKMHEVQAKQQMQPINDENNKIDSKTSQDKEQSVKANVANNVSADIMANYMKYYHLM